MTTARYFSAYPSDPASRRTPCPPKLLARWLQVRLGRLRLSPACPFRLLHTFLSLRPARHYPRLWIQRSSSERRRDLNPPDLGAAQRTLCPLLTSAPRSSRLATASVPEDTAQISRSKPDSLHRIPAGFTALVLDGYGLCECLPARPTSAASYPVSVRRVATLLHASFRQSLAVLPLRFASASPPSGRTGDFHPQTVGHVRHTDWRCAPPRLARLRS